MINTDGIVSIAARCRRFPPTGLCSIRGAGQLDSNELLLDIDVLDGDRRNQHRHLPPIRLLVSTTRSRMSPPRIHEEILDVADVTVCRVQMKTLQIACLVKHMQPSR